MQSRHQNFLATSPNIIRIILKSAISTLRSTETIKRLLFTAQSSCDKRHNAVSNIHGGNIGRSGTFTRFANNADV